MELAMTCSYPAPRHCEMHVGSLDWQSNPNNVTKFGELVDGGKRAKACVFANPVERKSINPEPALVGSDPEVESSGILN